MEATENNEEQNKQGNEDTLSQLTKMVDRLEKANEEAKKYLKQQEELIARKLLGGETNAGVQITKPKEETPQEYAKRVLGNR